ncbi:MAG: endonuclease III [Coriobacteriia bacterium]
MDVGERALEIDRRLTGLYPGARIMLSYDTDFHLLVAVILSAQCTDRKVNEVTAALFPKYPTVASFAGADPADLERDLRPTGFFRNKTRNVIGAARLVLEEHGGTVPDTMEELLTLPGVARKTANVVLGNLFGKVEGIAVDTHVSRLAHRLGLSSEKDPVKVERDLMALLPRKEWFRVTYRLIEHGRAVCDAKRPVCGACVLNGLCPNAFAVQGWREAP